MTPPAPPMILAMVEMVVTVLRPWGSFLPTLTTSPTLPGTHTSSYRTFRPGKSAHTRTSDLPVFFPWLRLETEFYMGFLGIC